MEQTAAEQKDIRILAIESSCDETAAAVVENGRTVRSNVIYSQIATHTLYGGVVPEIASRAHIEKINQVVAQALSDAGLTLAEIDAIGVTYGPGLVGPLLIGVSAAKAMAWAAGKPLIGVNHIEGHVSANFIANPDLKPPFLCLIVSGGHTNLVMVEDYGSSASSGRPGTMRRARPLTRWRARWDSGTPVGRKSTKRRGRETPMPSAFRAPRSRIRPMTSASAA